MDRDAEKADRQDQALHGDTDAPPGVAAAGERVEDAGPSDRSVFADEPPPPQLSAFATDDAGSADRTTVDDQEANQAGRQRP
jgi:hypothetical protein